jgi:hypothetical protein
MNSQKVQTSPNYKNIILVFFVLFHEMGTILSIKRGITPIILESNPECADGLLFVII